MTNRQARKVVYALLALLTFSISARSARAQNPTADSAEIGEILRGMESEEWKARAEAFYRLTRLRSERAPEGGGYLLPSAFEGLFRANPTAADQIKLALNELLEKENAVVQGYAGTGKSFGEDHSNYYGDVIAAVASLNDVRSMNALLGAIATGGMATRTLAGFAPDSLDPVLAKLNDNDPLVRSSALFVLKEMLSPSNYPKIKASPYRSKIKKALLGAAVDPDASVRATAVYGLAALGDPDAIEIVEKLAREDPAYLPGRAEGEKNYLVRHAAKLALAELRSKAQKQEDAKRAH